MNMHTSCLALAVCYPVSDLLVLLHFEPFTLKTMGRSVNEPQVSASAQHMSEWTIDTARHLSRELRGTELMVRASELVHDGNVWRATLQDRCHS